jgi:hypothetical protein
MITKTIDFLKMLQNEEITVNFMNIMNACNQVLATGPIIMNSVISMTKVTLIAMENLLSTGD